MRIELTKEEALVLSDWLYNNSSNAERIGDSAAQRVLWNIECQLEKELVEPHMSDYHEHLARARENVLMKWGNCISVHRKNLKPGEQDQAGR